MPRPPNTEQRREQIVLGMLHVLAEHGYEGASTQRIAHAARLTPGLIHYHFGSKQEILLALIELLAGLAAGRVERYLARAEDARARLHSFLEAMLGLGSGANPEAVAAWVAITAEAIREPRIARAVRAVVQSWQRELQRLCEPLAANRRTAVRAAAGVPSTDSVVNSLYHASQQSMPAGPLVAAFGSAQQTAFSQLAHAYCTEMMASSALRDTFFGLSAGNSFDANLTGNVSWFGGSLSANRLIVINGLVNNAVGNANPQVQTAVRNEVDAFITHISAPLTAGSPAVTTPALNPNATVSQATVAACTAVLGSAAVTLQ